MANENVVMNNGDLTAVGRVTAAKVKVPAAADMEIGVSDTLASKLAEKQGVISASGILKGDGAGGISAAEAGTDYISSHQDISGKANISDFSIPQGGGAPSAQYVQSLFSGANTSLAAQVRYDLGTAITASATLVDRTINLVQVSSADIDLTLPGVRSDGRLRDFLIRIEMAAGATGSPNLVSFTAWEGDDMPTFAAGKNYLITLTETKAGTWFFKAIELEAKTAPTP